LNRLALMETFIGVVETGSFSAAAKRLRVGQPAVSKSVAQLERRLGVRLLMRSTRGLTPTEAGQNFYERARRTIEEADEADLAARGASPGLVGILRVSAAVSLACLHIVPRLPFFLAAHPSLSVDLILSDRQVDLIPEGVDIAFRAGQLRDSSLIARKIATCRRLVLGAPSYFERAGVPATPAELARHMAVIYSEQGEGVGGDNLSFRQGELEIPVTLSGRLRISAAEGVRAAVAGGMGLAIASEWMFAPEIASGAVRAVVTAWPLPALDLWAVFPASSKPNAKARTFAAFVEAEMRKPYSAQE